MFLISIASYIFHERGSGDEVKSIQIILGFASRVELLLPNSKTLVLVEYITSGVKEIDYQDVRVGVGGLRLLLRYV
jgi:hypothetical protein